MIPNDEKFKEIYQEERNKLSQLPCADDDFEALEKTLKRWFEGSE